MEADPAYYKQRKNGSKIRGGFLLHTNRRQLPAFGFCEKEFIGQYFEKVFQHQMKTCMGLSIIFCAIGIFCVSACSVRGFLSLVIGLIAFILAFGTLRTKKKYLNNIQVFQNGQFQVLEGNVAEIFANMEYPGCCNVRFQSAKGEILKMLCTVRQEELQVGTPLLLAYADENVVKGGISRAFTPYMMTEEGSRHWLQKSGSLPIYIKFQEENL